MKLLKEIKHIKHLIHLYESPPGRLLLAGLLIGFVYAIFLLTYLIVNPEFAQHLWVMTVTHVMFGRAAGISYGYTVPINANWIILINMLIESVIVMLVFPFFVFGLKKLKRFDYLHRTLRKIEVAAYKNKKFIKRYGLVGLFAFVCFPFWMTGPLVGAFIGHLLGFTIVLNMTVVLSGTFLAIVGWSFILYNVTEKISEFSTLAPFFLLMVLVALAVSGNLISSEEKK